MFCKGAGGKKKKYKLEQDKMKNMEIDTEHFSLMKIMADRDFEIESRLNSNSFVEDLKAEWNAKTKIEKQEFIESMVLEKDEEEEACQRNATKQEFNLCQNS